MIIMIIIFIIIIVQIFGWITTAHKLSTLSTKTVKKYIKNKKHIQKILAKHFMEMC